MLGSRETGKKSGPPPPPAILHGRDPSTKEKHEVYQVKLNTATPELQKSLAPPGVPGDMAANLCEGMLDAVSLPGKLVSSTETKDTADAIQASLMELVHLGHKGRGDKVRRDVKWQSAGRNSLMTIKNTPDLHELYEDILSIEDDVLDKMVATQRSILHSTGWDEVYVEAWATSGYLPVLFRRTLTGYKGLLEHLKRCEEDCGWEQTKLELHYFSKQMANVRNLATSCIHAMCKMYAML